MSNTAVDTPTRQPVPPQVVWTTREQQAECAEDTRRLLTEALTASSSDRERLYGEAVLLNLGVAEALARRYARREQPLEDLTQVAYLGLTKAVRGFDPHRGTDFLQYAVPTILGELKRYFRDHAWAVRPPRRLQELRLVLGDATADLTQELARPPRPSEIAERVGATAGDVMEALATDQAYRPTSLDEPGRSGRAGSGGVDAVGAGDPGLERAEVVVLLRALCRTLDPTSRHVLYRRFFCDWRQSAIAAELGVSQMQVSRLLRRVLAALRDQLEAPPAPRPNGSGPPSAA